MQTLLELQLPCGPLGDEPPHPPRLMLSGDASTLLNLENSQPGQAIAERCAALAAVTLGDGHLADPDPDRRRAAGRLLDQLVDLAARRRIPHLSIAPATIIGPRAAAYQEALNHTLHAVRDLVPRLEAGGVTLCLRAATGGFLLSPPELRELVDLLNSPSVGVDLDAPIAFRDDRAAPGDWLATLGPRIQLLGLPISPRRREDLLAGIVHVDEYAPRAARKTLEDDRIDATAVLRVYPES